MTLNKDIGALVKRTREAKGVKQQSLAKHLRVSTATISMLENGDIDFSVSRIEKIASFLQVNFSQLIPSSLNNPGMNSSAGKLNHPKKFDSDLMNAIVNEIADRLKR